MVGTNVAFEATIVVCFENFQDARIPVAITMACFGEVAVLKVFYVADMRKSNSITMLSDDFRYVIFGVCI